MFFLAFFNARIQESFFLGVHGREKMSIKLVVIGAGPAGYPAALTAAKLGAEVTVIEKAHAGGVCLHSGCIPSKSLLDAAHRLDVIKNISSLCDEPASASAQTLLQQISWPKIQSRQQAVTQKLTLGITGLFRQAKVNVVSGIASFKDKNTLLVKTGQEEQEIPFDYAIVCSGSTAFVPPPFDKIREHIYDNSNMSTLNTVVVRGKLAFLCALDQYKRITTLVLIQDLEKVNQLYLKLIPVFRSSAMLLHHARAAEFNKSGYRTDFYARENYQILTAKGFEFLLPLECWEPIMQAALEKDDGGFEARMVKRMQITWEEIFEKNSMDFFTTKSSLLKYLEDGEIVFLDVVYHMSVPERKLHIQKVLDITKKNPNIHFFVIDDDCLPEMQHLFGASVYSNRRKIFLKNLWRLREESEAQFYCVDSEQMTGDIVAFLDRLRDSVYCYPFDAESLQRFIDRYGSMINRMLELNERKA